MTHHSIRNPPLNAPSSDDAFAEAIQNQDESISIETHLPHWQAVRRFWVNYFESQSSLMVSPELVKTIMGGSYD